MELIALSLPLLASVIFLYALFMLFRKRYFGALSLLIVFVVMNWYGRIFPLNAFKKHFDNITPIKVMTLNTSLSPNKDNYYENLKYTANLILKEKVDVVFLTENFYCNFDTLYRMIQPFFPYKSKSANPCGNYIYSKYPLIMDSLIVSDSITPYALNICKLKISKRTINLVGCHFSSNNYDERMYYRTPEQIKSTKQFYLYLKNIIRVSQCRQKQAKKIVDLFEDELPLIIVGDFNDVSGSSTLNILEKAGLSDAWWEGGMGFGFTVYNPFPFRIDHILYNQRFKLINVKVIKMSTISDHNAIVGGFNLKN